MEADFILRIPLGLRSVVDGLVWHYNPRGIFSVKSAYLVSCKRAKLGIEASTSGFDGVKFNIWSTIWKARVPPKVKTFVWRSIRGILPTRGALCKKVPIPDTCCVFYKKYDEIDMHLFKCYGALESFWKATPMTFNLQTVPALNLKDWITEVMIRSPR